MGHAARPLAMKFLLLVTGARGPEQGWEHLENKARPMQNRNCDRHVGYEPKRLCSIRDERRFNSARMRPSGKRSTRRSLANPCWE